MPVVKIRVSGNSFHWRCFWHGKKLSRFELYYPAIWKNSRGSFSWCFVVSAEKKLYPNAGRRGEKNYTTIETPKSSCLLSIRLHLFSSPFASQYNPENSRIRDDCENDKGRRRRRRRRSTGAKGLVEVARARFVYPRVFELSHVLPYRLSHHRFSLFRLSILKFYFHSRIPSLLKLTATRNTSTRYGARINKDSLYSCLIKEKRRSFTPHARLYLDDSRVNLSPLVNYYPSVWLFSPFPPFFIRFRFRSRRCVNLSRREQMRFNVF